jgi:O-antigen ligase
VVNNSVPLLYALLFVTPFHNDPRLGVVLLRAGVAIVTPIKILGLLTAAFALVAPMPKDAAPHLRSSLTALFLPFAVVPVVVTMVYGLPTPTQLIGQMLSATLLFLAIVPLVRTEDRMFKVVRTLTIGFTVSSLWIYKAHFIGHEARPSGLEGDGNYDALMFLLSLPLSFWMIRYDESKWWRRIGLASFVVLASAVVLIESRAAFIAGGAMVLFAAVRTRHKLLGLTLIAVAAVVLFSLGFGQRLKSIKLEGQTINGAEKSSRIHFELFKCGLHMIEAHPIFGVGLQQFMVVAPDYNPELVKVGGHSWIAHDTFLQIGAEAGIPTLLLFLAMLGVCFRNFRAAQRSSNKRLAALGLAMTVSLLGISIAGLSITAEFLPFCILIVLSQSLREIASAATIESLPIQRVATPVLQPRREVA